MITPANPTETLGDIVLDINAESQSARIKRKPLPEDPEATGIRSILRRIDIVAMPTGYIRMMMRENKHMKECGYDLHWVDRVSSYVGPTVLEVARATAIAFIYSI